MEKGLESGHLLDSGHFLYAIEKVLGQGGFGITYLATTTVKVGNVSLNAKFAIKEHFISSDCERDEGTSKVVYSAPAKDRVENSRKDFIAEAKRLQSVGNEHPGIVKINEIFEANNTAYYVMEYLEGIPLREYVTKRKKLSEDEMRRLITPIMEAVGVLHRNRMTHLDIKPDNIMVTKDNDSNIRPVLIDFGLSKHYRNDGTPTSTINTLGCSDGYSPVEQYLGITTFSPEADIYSIRATIYYCLIGKNPKKASNLRDEELAKDLEDLVSASTCEMLRKATRHSKFDREKDIYSLFTRTTASEKQKTNSYQHSTDTTSHQSSSDSNETKVIGSDSDKKVGADSNLWKIITGIVVLAIVGLGICFLTDGKAEPNDDEITVIESVTDMDWGSPLGKAKYTGEVVYAAVVADSVYTDSSDTPNYVPVPDGTGIAIITEGKYAENKYEGHFNLGNLDGQITATQNNGDIFEGTFSNNEYDDGKYTIASTREYFIGTFKNGQPDKGMWYDKNGNNL